MPSPMEVIAEPMRREILRAIWDQECSVGALVEAFGVSQPAISFHLRVLRENGLVAARNDGARRYYRAQPEGLGPLRGYLEAYWSDRLARLKDEAELEARRLRRLGN